MTDEKIMSTIKPDGEYWQPEIETMPREQLEALQVKKLKESINVALKSPFYKERLGKLGITADSINSLADLRKIPFTTKQDLRDNYPFGLVGRSLDDAVRIHSTSGTTGNPCVVVYSEHDICSWANMIARNLYMVGCRKSDVFQNSSGYGMFTGGLGFQYGAEWLGTMTPDQVHQGLWHHRASCYPLICHPPGRGVQGGGRGSCNYETPHALHRCRAPYRGAAPPH